MQENNTELTVSTEVLEKMAEIAACEIDGVAGLSKKTVDLKNALKNMNAFKGVTVENHNGTVSADIYIILKKSAKMRETAEAVQSNVKEKIQNMTGTAVTNVNVTVADIDNSED